MDSPSTSNIASILAPNWFILREEMDKNSKTRSKSRKKKDKKSKNIIKKSTHRKGDMKQNENKWKNQKDEISKSIKENKSDARMILALDCEYVGTGFEGRDDIVARVSIVDSNGAVVYDKYVKATDEVTDYRTEVSGIRPGHMEHGENFANIQQEVHKIMSDCVIVGHSLHNDFRVLGLHHPSRLIRDTAKYKPLRQFTAEKKMNKMPSLKLLAYHILGVQIQQGEHDSITDARTAMKIYLVHKKLWDQDAKMHKNSK